MSGQVMPLTSNLRVDVRDGGHYSIQGTITEKSVPGSYRVWLHDQETGRPIRETWSATNGSYSFTYLDAKPKFIMAFDHTSPVQRAEMQDNVVAS